MARFSHIMVGVLNSLSLLWSILAILLSAYAFAQFPDKCDSYDPLSTLLFGVFLFSLSLVALIGAIRANRRLLLVYVGVLFAWIVWLIGLSTFLFIVSNASVAKAAKHHKEYQLNEYPVWLRRYTVDGENWVSLKKCMVKQQICRRLLSEADTDENGDLRIEKPSILYSCCQPPLHCGLVSKNDTSFDVPKKGITSDDPDCRSWSNDLEQACYDCNSCKAGYIRTLKAKWLEDAQFNAGFSLLIVIVFCIAFWAFRQAPPTENNHHAADNVAAVA